MSQPLRALLPVVVVLAAAVGLAVRGQDAPRADAGAMTQLEQAIASAASSVVRVELVSGSPRKDTPRRRFFRPLADREQASGIVVGKRLVLTHVALGLYEDPRYSVTVASGKRYEATLRSADPEREVALLQTREDLDAPVAETSPSGALRPGTLVLAVGDPFGMASDAQAAAALGVLEGRTVLDAAETTFAGEVLLTDAPINPGSEGGPLVDVQGRVIGVLAPLAFDRRLQVQGVGPRPHGRALTGYAIPIEVALGLVRPRAPRTELKLGFQGRRGERGIEVVTVVSEGRAARAGLEPGDVILAADDVAVRGGDDLRRVVAAAQGESLSLTVERQGVRRQLVLSLKEER